MKIGKARFRVPGGVHPAYCKDVVKDKAIEEMPIPPILRVSMAQHLGAPAIPAVKKGDAVQCGQVIGQAAGFISAAVHAPTSGTVKTIEDEPTAMGMRSASIAIEPDGEDSRIAVDALPGWDEAGPKDLVDRVADAGIAGMGGAGFPTHVKLSPPPSKPIDTLIINGAECEPYLTADHRLMLEHPEQIWTGARIIRKILGAGKVRLAIEDNKPDAITAMEKAMSGADGDVEIVVLKTEYPQGAEKQQIYGITGREVPSGGLPMDVGCLVENVGTVMAVWDAIVNGQPLTERVTTVTGSPVSNPKNVRARLGTPYSDLLDFCGGMAGAAAKAVSGGPMMGLAQPGLETTTTKTTSGLLFLALNEVDCYESMPCISCGRCVAACPMRLMPSELSQMLEAEDFEAAAELNVMDCIECGCCSFSCPAHRPLVQHLKSGKAWVTLQKRKAAQSK